VSIERTLTELEAENDRLREELEYERSKTRDVTTNDLGVAGRVAITRLRDADLPELVRAVERIPEVYTAHGRMTALSYCRVYIRSLVDAIVLQAPRTADLVRALHRIHAMLSEGQAEVMMRGDVAGSRSRADFLEVVERFAYAPSVRSAFARSSETPPGLISPTYIPNRGPL